MIHNWQKNWNLVKFHPIVLYLGEETNFPYQEVCRPCDFLGCFSLDMKTFYQKHLKVETYLAQNFNYLFSQKSYQSCTTHKWNCLEARYVLEPVCCNKKKSPNQETGYRHNRGHLKVLNDTIGLKWIWVTPLII